MKKGQTFVKGVILLTVAGLIVRFIGFVYRVVLTNLPGYGDEGNGIYGTGYQVYLVLYALSTTGFPSAISKLVAEKCAVGDWRGAHRIFKVSFRLLFCTGLVVTLIFFTASEYIARLISNPRSVYTMLSLSPTIFFVSIMAAYRGYFQGMQDMSPQAYSQIVEQLSKTIFTIVLAYAFLPYGVELAAAGATMGTTLGAAAGAIYLWVLYNRRKKTLWGNIRHTGIGLKQQSSAAILKKLISIAMPISMGAVILTVANIIDLGTVMSQLGKAGFDTKTANEMYGILTGKCYVLVHFPTSIFVALATGLVPAIAGSVAVKDFKSASEKISISMRLTMLLGAPSSVGMAVLSKPILKMLFPGSSEGAYLLAIASISIIFTGLTQTLSGILQGLGKVMTPVAGLLLGAAFKLAVNYALVPLPHINIRGAVYGTIICYFISSAVCFIMLKINFKLNLGIYNFIIKPVAASLIMGVFAYYSYLYVYDMTSNVSISTLITIFAAVVVYIMIILLLGGITSKDIAVLPFGKNINGILFKLKLIRR